jgi:D-hexose-6-phosphate mutarotase
VEKSKGMGDFHDQGYKGMICVEVGSVVEDVVLAAGESRVFRQIVTILDGVKL